MERECWDGEEIHGCDDLPVIAQISSPEFPCLAGRRQAPDIARDGTLGDVESVLTDLLAIAGHLNSQQTISYLHPGYGTI